MKRLSLLLFMVLLAGACLAAEPNPLPGDSIYQLKLTLTDQDGHQQTLAERRGTPQLVTMFYTSCTMVCPMIMQTLKMTRKVVGDPARDQLGILAVSFDPETDDVDALHHYFSGLKIDPSVWTLARAEASGVRQFAAVLGLQYRQLPDQNFNHSSQLVLVDREGRIAARTSVLGKVDPEFVAKVQATLGSPQPVP